MGNAAHTIQEAIDGANHGDVIVVTNGVYDRGGKAVPGLGSTKNRVAIDKPMSAASVNGPSRTVIKGEKVPETIHGPEAVRCVYMANGAVLAGFTLNNGATPSGMPHVHGGGAYLSHVDNCTVQSNMPEASKTFQPKKQPLRR